jgi:hypothetical protein
MQRSGVSGGAAPLIPLRCLRGSACVRGVRSADNRLHFPIAYSALQPRR